MKKFTKILAKVMPIVLCAVIVFTNVYGINAEVPAGGTAISDITDIAQNIWQTVAVIIQILAIAAIVIAGVRYMFASADQKADIKKQTIVLVVGAILVFAAVPLAQFIANTAKDIIS